MLWLIWIAIMLVVPVLAGVAVWVQIRQAPREVPIENTASHDHRLAL